MANEDVNPKLDIWGEPEYTPHECFKCGELYPVGSSTAPIDYRTTYCSIECYTKDHAVMEQASQERAKIIDDSLIGDDPSPIDSEAGYTTSKIGDFILKVKKPEKKEGE